MITDKAYKVRWNGSGSETWELKRRIYSDYSMVEDISDFVAPKPEDLKFDITYKDVDVKWHPYFLETEICTMCGGSGQIPDDKSTAGTKLCMSCGGCGHKTKKVELFFD